MSTTLNSEVECFLAEVDALTFPDSIIAGKAVPKTDWVAHVDPKSGLPFYYNCASQTSTWEMPEEYRQYLQNYEKFLENGQKAPEAHKHVENTNDSAGGDVNSGIGAMPEGNARKRRRIKRAYLRSEAHKSVEDSTPVEFLSEYIAYSNSSGSDSEGTKDSPSPSPSDKSLSSNGDLCSQGSPLPPKFIGPLPAENISTDTQLQDTIGPNLPDSNAVAEISSSGEVESMTEISESKPSVGPHDLPINQRVDTSELNNLTQLLLEKFAFLDVHVDKFTPLQLLYVQLSTRFEDWTAGFLPSSRFREKLEEVNSYVLNYEQSRLPAGWSCEWDSYNKRYLYICKATGISQQHFPLPQPVDTDNQSKPVFPAYASHENPDECSQGVSESEKAVSPEERGTHSDPSPNETVFIGPINRPLDLPDEDYVPALDSPALSETGTVSQNETVSESVGTDSEVEAGEPPKRRVKKMILSSRVVSSNKDLPDLVSKWQKLQQSL
ncbi:hypothetical protein AAHC03_010115 [Spirometra sp. Aus1]